MGVDRNFDNSKNWSKANYQLTTSRPYLRETFLKKLSIESILFCSKMHRSRGAINLLWQQKLLRGAAANARPVTALMHSASSPPPPASALAQESFLSGSNSAYVDEMFDAWSRDPASVHASWDAYFRGVSYTPPPSLGNTKANEVPLSAIAPALSAAAGSPAVGAPSAHVIGKLNNC